MKTKVFLTSLFLFCAFFSAEAQTADEYYNLSKEKLKKKDYNYAKTLIDKSIALDSTNVWTWLLSAEINLGLNQVQEAFYDYGSAIRIDSTVAEIYNRVADLYTSINYLEESIFFYDKAIEYAKSDTMKFNYLMNRASAKGILRDFEGGIADLEDGLKIDSTNSLILNNLPMFYQEVGQVDKAIKILNTSVRLYPEFNGSMINLGLIYSEIDSLDKSEFYFNMAMEIDPKDPLLLNNRGYLFLKKKEYDKALKDINESLNIYPNNSYAYRNRALVYIELELIEEACRDLSIAEHYNFKTRYGDEVQILKEKYCKE